jgi:hypothetical protein
MQSSAQNVLLVSFGNDVEPSNTLLFLLKHYVTFYTCNYLEIWFAVTQFWVVEHFSFLLHQKFCNIYASIPWKIYAMHFCDSECRIVAFCSAPGHKSMVPSYKACWLTLILLYYHTETYSNWLSDNTIIEYSCTIVPILAVIKSYILGQRKYIIMFY